VRCRIGGSWVIYGRDEGARRKIRTVMPSAGKDPMLIITTNFVNHHRYHRELKMVLAVGEASPHVVTTKSVVSKRNHLKYQRELTIIFSSLCTLGMAFISTAKRT
jgi:hypothetical protein